MSTLEQSQQITRERRYANALAGAIRASVDDLQRAGPFGMTRAQHIASLRRYLAGNRVLADMAWQFAQSPWATGRDGWTDKPGNADAFWELAEALEDPQAHGILIGSEK